MKFGATAYGFAQSMESALILRFREGNAPIQLRNRKNGGKAMKVKKIEKTEREYPFIQYCWFKGIVTRLKGEITYIGRGGLQVLKVQDCIYSGCSNYHSDKCLIGKELQSIWIRE